MTGGVLRQVHLDFHTSEVIDKVAAGFDAEAFAEQLAAAHVNSVNVFGKCHHGWSYFPSSVGRMHPGLDRDLLGEQLQALRARGIKAPVYVSVLWDDLAAVEHPEWVAVDVDGNLLARPALANTSVTQQERGWSVMDLASGVADYIVDHVAEICRTYRPDGFWFDIVSVVPSYSPAAVARMKAAGVRIDRPEEVTAYYLAVRDAFVARVGAVVRGHLPDASIAHNHTTDAWLGGTAAGQTQVDVESLPTDGTWGYSHFPVYARYARRFGLPMVGMTGRFHRSWADFGGLKTADQLAFEAGTILSAGGGIAIGDQLDPSGQLDEAVYRSIGRVFERVESLEPYLVDATHPTEAAVVAAWVPSKSDAGRRMLALSQGAVGASHLLMEHGVQFDIVDAERLRPGEYRLLVLPDDARPDAAQAEAIKACLVAGARLLVAGRALFDAEGQPVLADAPCRLVGTSPTTPSYQRLDDLAAEGSRLDPSYLYACYGEALRVSAVAGAEAQGEVVAARFNRTWEHFTSHIHAPAGSDVVGPLMTSAGQITHVAVPLFSDYAEHSYWVNSAMLATTMDELLPERLVRHDGPPWAEVTVHRQVAEPGRPERTLVHIVCYQPSRGSSGVPRIDTTHPIAGFPIVVAVPAPVLRVYDATTQAPVSFVHEGFNYVRVTPACVGPHTVIVLDHTATDHDRQS